MPSVEEALCKALGFCEGCWDLERSGIQWDLVWEGGGRREGQLESLQVCWECVVGHLSASSTSTCISVREGFLTTRSARLLTSQQANSICPSLQGF